MRDLCKSPCVFDLCVVRFCDRREEFERDVGWQRTSGTAPTPAAALIGADSTVSTIYPDWCSALRPGGPFSRDPTQPPAFIDHVGLFPCDGIREVTIFVVPEIAGFATWARVATVTSLPADLSAR